TTTLVFMTATGGRPNHLNEYIFRNDTDGTLYYNFTILDRAIDWASSGNFHIEFVIGNMPHVLAINTTDYGAFEALVSPPANYTLYEEYIGSVVQHLIDRYGVNYISSWEWRLYTEPDGTDPDGTGGWWYNGDPAEYTNLWIASMRPVKQKLPGARLVLGNMMDHNKFDFVEYVLEHVNDLNVSLLPDTISFSYYNNLVDFPNYDDLQSKFAFFSDYLEAMGISKSFNLSVEEGNVIYDEHGDYLGGDATELGAAWEAWCIRSCLERDVTRFTDWTITVDEYLLPKGYVQMMADRMAGSRLARVTPRIPAFANDDMQHIDGFAVSNGTTAYKAIVYQFFPDRFVTTNQSVQLALRGIEAGTYNFTLYRVDKDSHNWFTHWLGDSVNLTLADGFSRYNTGIGDTYTDPDRYIFWWNWRADHQMFNPRQLLPESSSIISFSGGATTLDLALMGNCVVLVELTIIR
nr:hypothetical protein [Candidatus Sigynarchaeota archaeon]